MLSTHGCSGPPTPMRILSTSAKGHKSTLLTNLLSQFRCMFWILSLCCIWIVAPAIHAFGFNKSSDSEESSRLMMRMEAPESDVQAAVEQVTQDQIIHGTYSYDKERILYGAHSAESAKIFGPWKGTGKAYYKVANNILSPRFFKGTEDIGTISVRYVVQSADANSTIVQIEAIFVDARSVRHPSIGTVEASEFAAIQQHLRTIQSKQQSGQLSAATSSSAALPPSETPTTSAVNTVSAPPENVTLPAMQKHVDALRHQVELRVKDPGAQLRASPFHSAAAIETLPTESEVLIVVVTPYWYGVETEDGHRGWVHHSQLEPLP
jgi:hypothetical protein